VFCFLILVDIEPDNAESARLFAIAFLRNNAAEDELFDDLVEFILKLKCILTFK